MCSAWVLPPFLPTPHPPPPFSLPPFSRISGLRNQYNHTSLIKIQGLEDSKDADFYLGKRVAFVYKGKKDKQLSGGASETKFRVIWGKVCRSHGTNGVVRCKFRSNLPGKALGGPVRVMLYPSRV